MRARLRSWRQKTSKTLDAVIISSLAILLILLVVIILGYIFNWSWAGLHGKTLYDWLQLLIIPAVLAVGGYLFNYTTSRNEQAIASDNQREAAMKEYFDQMSELMLHENLRKSGKDDEVRNIAHTLTLTVLPRLDGGRKKNVVQFLADSGLIDKGNTVIQLYGADLSEANLSEANLSGVDLSNANLSSANLYGADLTEVRLHGANLSEAYLSDANLLFADLSGATLQPHFLNAAIKSLEQG